MRKLLLTCSLWLFGISPVFAQVSGPNFVFTNGQVADAGQVNTDFSTIYAAALNRNGGTMLGTLNTLSVIPSLNDNSYDLGSSSLFFRSIYAKTSLVLGQTGGNYTLTWANPAAARAISIADPGGTDVFTFNAATQTLTNKTLTAPVLSGTATGTYTLGGTPTISAPVLSGTVTGTYTLGGTPTITAPILSGTVTGTYTLGGTPTLTAPALTGATTSTGSLQFTANAAYPGGGSISKQAVNGLFIGAATGSSIDFAVVNPSGASSILYVPTGTLNVDFNGSILFPTSVTYPGAGSLSKGASSGLVVGAVAGSTYDFALTNPSGASSIIAVPTGTLNVTLGGLLTVNGTGTSVFTGSTAGIQSVQLLNTASGTSARAYHQVSAGTTNAYLQVLSQGWTTSNDLIQSGAALESTGAGGLQLSAANAAGSLGFWTGATPSLQWGVNSAGDFTHGPNSHIAWSTGTPSTQSGFGTGGGFVAGGTDFSFFVLTGTTANTGGTISFGHTWTNAPVCNVTPSATAIGVIAASSSGSSVAITYASTSTNTTLNVTCSNGQ